MRNEINQKPHQILWLGLAVILGFSYLIQCETIDIQMHDTYLVTTPFQLASSFALLLGALGGIYWMVVRSGKKLTKWMTMVHIAFSLFTAITFVYVGCQSEQSMTSGSPTGSTVFTTGILIFSIAQFVFIINIIYSFFKK